HSIEIGMGERDRSIDEVGSEAEDVDTSRLLSLLSVLSQSARRAEGDGRPLPHASSKDRDNFPNESSKPGHGLIAPAVTEAPVRHLARRGVVPNFQSALDDVSPRQHNSGLRVADRLPATTPVAGRRRWLVWMLGSSIIAGGTAAAFSFNVADG